MTEYQKQWHEKNKPRKLEYMRRYRAENREACIASTKRCAKNNAEKYAVTKRAWAAKNEEKVRGIKRKYADANVEKLRVRARESAVQRRETDENFKLKGTLRCRLYAALKKAGARRAAKTFALVGCDLQFLRGYLEARFQPGMTWANHGEWHVDHHVPLAEFDLRDPAQQKQAFHFSNLRPLWAKDNLSKNKKRPPTHQAELI